MKKIIYILILFLSCYATQAGAKLRFDCGDVYDWGKVKFKQSPLNCNVKIFNDGDDTLRIYKVKPSCGCTTPELSKDLIAPGDFATLNLKLNLSRSNSKISKSLKILTNDLSVNTHKLLLTAEVETGFDISPKRYIFKDLTLMKKIEEKIEIKNMSEYPMEIDSISTNLDGLKITPISNSNKIGVQDSAFYNMTFLPLAMGRGVAEIRFHISDNLDVEDIVIRSVFDVKNQN